VRSTQSASAPHDSLLVFVCIHHQACTPITTKRMSAAAPTPLHERAQLENLSDMGGSQAR
jgi:hypothetical protein